jgi:hypothetical protein
VSVIALLAVRPALLTAVTVWAPAAVVVAVQV